MVDRRALLRLPREEYVARVGEDVESGYRAPAPGPLNLVQRFLNTSLPELGVDRLDTPRKAAEWLKRHGLLSTEAAVGESARRRLVDVREGLRGLALSHVGRPLPRGSMETLDEAAQRARFVIRFGPDGSTLEPMAPGVDGAIGRVLAVVDRAMADGTWHRFKACRECEYAFYDRSKNRAGEWCSMSVCGNRTKNRRYRERRQTGV